MSRVQVFDPPMCCSTGVCGPQVDPALVRFSADLEWLKANGVEVERFNLSQQPAAFVGNPVIAQAIGGRDDALPILLVDGAIAAQGTYPARDVLAGLVGLSAAAVEPTAAAAAPNACCPSSDVPVALGQPGAARKKCC